MRVLFALVVTLVVAAPTLKPVVNQEINYNVGGTVDSKGRNGALMSEASIGALQGVFATKCIGTNSTMAVFVCNMFDVVVGVSQGSDNSEAPRKLTTSGDEPLGYDMYYYQTPDGLIPLVEYDSRDSLYYVQVKLAAINSLQTSIKAGSVKVDDPTGVHFTSFGVSELTVEGSFSAASYVSFMDPTVSARNVQLVATASATFHPSGYIVSASNQQEVALVRGQAAASVTRDTDTSGFDMYMASTGRLSLNATTASGSRLSSRSRAVPSNLLVGSLSQAARLLHAGQMELRAEEVAAALPALIASDRLAQVTPFVGFAVVRRQLRRMAKQVKIARVDRFLRVCALAGLSDVLIRFVKSHRAEVEAALWYAPHRCRASAICGAVKNAPGLAAHLGCAGSKPLVAKAAAPQLSLPFNRSGSATVAIGGKTIGLSFTASYLVGTNLNCKNPQFAYEATADLQGSVNLFGETEQAFDANFIYGQNGAAPLADAATLTAFGKPVWGEHLPVESYCKAESLPIGKVQKGVSVSHTVWVSIVPVTFTASADVTLSLAWQWSLCSNDLSASVGITPGTAVVVSGSTLVDLLVLRAGVTLEGDFAATVVPQVFVAGTACSAGADAVLSRPGNSGELAIYYMWRKCKWLFFDCHWEEQKKKDLWVHHGVPSQSTIFNKTFTISI